MVETKNEAYAQLLGAYIEQLNIAYGNYINAQLALTDKDRNITLSDLDMRDLYSRIDQCRFWYIQTRIKFDALAHKLEISKQAYDNITELCKKIEAELTADSMSKYLIQISKIYIDNISPEFLNPPGKQIDTLGV